MFLIPSENVRVFDHSDPSVAWRRRRDAAERYVVASDFDGIKGFGPGILKSGLFDGNTAMMFMGLEPVLMKAIEELAGHADLETTQRYMHLSPAAKDAAIALLDAEVVCTGDILETGSGSQCNLR